MELRRKKSLKFRNEIINKLKEELGIKFDYSFNDLYDIEGGNREVRRLKGFVSYKGKYDEGVSEEVFLEVLNEKIKESKVFFEGLSNEEFEVGFNKLNGGIFNKDFLKWKRERLMEDKNIFLNEEEVKEYLDYRERCVILKIVYKKDEVNKK